MQCNASFIYHFSFTFSKEKNHYLVIHPNIDIMTRILKVSALLAAIASVASGNNVGVSTTSDTTSTVSCDLQCSNGGYCALIDGTPEELAKKAQSGHLIEKCVCQPGFTGISCQTAVEQCILPERKCHNGVPCTQNADGEWGCDCSVADSLSAFAGYQCRNPSTEYCTGKYVPNAALSFCTNGGRCEGDFIAAQVAPGDTAFNQVYQHRGCRCPHEFYGDHCEFIKFDEDDEMQQEIPFNPHASRSPATAIILTLMSLSLVMTVALIRRKLQGRRVPNEITIQFEESRTPSWGSSNRYSDSRYNGRHRPYISQNIHIQTVFEDAEMA